MKLKQYVALGLLLVSTYAHSDTWVQVEGRGTTKTKAEDQGKLTAIKQVVGQVIVSDRETSGGQLTRDFVGSYSAGYVTDSETLETRQDGSEVVVKMNVLVASSKIAQRMLSSSDKNLVVNGERLRTQLETQLYERTQGDALLSTVLSSYPYNAYVINSGSTEVIIDRLRQSYVKIDFKLEMSKYWLSALNEALTTMSADSTSCGTITAALVNGIRQANTYSTPVKNFVGRACGNTPDMQVSAYEMGSLKQHSYTFHDLRTMEMINAELQNPVGQQHVGLQVDLLDAGGDVIDSRCAKIKTEAFIKYAEPNVGSANWNNRSSWLRPSIIGQQTVKNEIWLHIHSLEQMNELARIKMSIQKTCT